MENKSNKGLIVLVIILIICVLGLLGYIVYEKTLPKKENNNNPTTSPVTTTIKEQEETEKKGNLTTATISNCTKEICSETIGNFKIEYRSNINSLDSVLTVNKKEVLSKFISIEKMYILDETLIVITGGTDIRSTKIHFFDKLGNKQKEIHSLDNNYIEMVISDDEEDSIKITEEGLTIKGTRLTHGPSIAAYQYDQNLNPDDYYIGNCTIYNKYKEDNIFGTYEIKYLGDNKFSDIKNISYTKLKDSNITCVE